MPIPPPKDHTTYREWLYLEPEGEISSAERSELERHLAGCRECRVEREQIAALDGLLAESRVEVAPDFAETVLADLPPAGWEGRNPRTWRTGALAAALVAGAAALVGWLGGGVPEIGALDTAVAAVAAVGRLFASAAVTGAGLLAASWQGLGLALGEILGASKLTLVTFGVFVLGVDVLFIRLLLRPSKSLSPATVDTPDRERDS